MSYSLEKFIIENIETVKPLYERNDSGIYNPYFHVLDKKTTCRKLDEDEKYIWALTSDLRLTVGVKNILFDKDSFIEELSYYSPIEHYDYINWDCRYGHASLAVPFDGYDGSVFYAGWLIQQKNFLFLDLTTGRFWRRDLNIIQKLYLELYLARKFIAAYGQQTIVFADNPNSITDKCPQRAYGYMVVEAITWLEEQNCSLYPFILLMYKEQSGTELLCKIVKILKMLSNLEISLKKCIRKLNIHFLEKVPTNIITIIQHKAFNRLLKESELISTPYEKTRFFSKATKLTIFNIEKKLIDNEYWKQRLLLQRRKIKGKSYP